MTRKCIGNKKEYRPKTAICKWCPNVIECGDIIQNETNKKN